MHKITTILVALCTLVLTTSASLAMQVSSGKLETIEAFKSKYIGDRKVMVWLPDGYSDDSQYIGGS